MKKLVLVLAIFAALFVTSCIKDSQSQTDNVIEDDAIEQADTAQLVTGVAIDGAMNSVFLKVGDDTVQFSYPDLDNDHRASWAINDTVTVKYFVTENGDSVTDVILGDIS